ncbi:Maf family protein [Sphingorhabdus wooponensis]|uniref:dTTP/UTP pyrophosphatase n=1 Tax=Sphingorhabdus wooponensis TaxID=940136 RepID=A0A426RV49_9SPHN|nr:nucleoside triphosphate pyrophosphatase [Sphingorhabdus wooponensis]RRQ52895.1 septum formation protein Maf [Sphingorhabdus wooponensis]
MNPILILASSSPRRRDLLARLGVAPARIASPDINETPRKGEVPRVYALRMAEEKAVAVARDAGEIVVAGDTTVAVGRRILPQAADADMQRGFLNLLSGRRHHVLSAVAVIDGNGRMRSRICDSIVRFKRLSAEEIESYIQSGEGLGKAGGYAIQGRAEALIDWMAGSHSGVIGLPLYETRALLRASGYPLD